MSDALPLPPQPNIEHYKKRAKDLVKVCRSGDRGELRAWAAEWIETLVRLHDLDVSLPRNGHRAYTPEELRYRIDRTVDRIVKHLGVDDRQPLAACTVARAQFALAREHGFASWPKFSKHLEGLALTQSPISAFEAAVDAVVHGDLLALDKLIRDDPTLVRMRSSREHRSTLLHYVSANGVEDYRQRTPKNIVAIAKLLLDFGADVNAESDAYGGRSTTLALTATSCHPQTAGVQLALLELLLRNGARIDGRDGGSTVNACLHNGRGEAAEYLANRGARLDLEGSAGVGRLDVVRAFFQEGLILKPPASREQMDDGFTWACEFGRTNVVDFLLNRGFSPDTKLRQNGETGLHWAAYSGHLATVKRLLDSGASVEIVDDSHGGTPLGWALYAWGSSHETAAESTRYYDVVALLVRAGAQFHLEWYEADAERQHAAAKAESDSRMRAALGGSGFPAASPRGFQS